MAKKPPKQAMKKSHFATVGGGPVERLNLPWPGVDVPGKDHLPVIVRFATGLYRRIYNPETNTYVYAWEGPPQ